MEAGAPGQSTATVALCVAQVTTPECAPALTGFRGRGHACVGPSLDRALCDNGPCPDNIHICDSKLVQYAKQTQQAILPLQKPPCSNMEFISQQMMLVDLCSAPSDYSNWVLGEDVKLNCSSLPLYIPIASVNRTSHARHYGILTDYNEGILKVIQRRI
ncbi:hypothetical protein MAR_035830 [Mya arenaria]|uniref:Uncharacterized protein n=1 Tax=Mya arenaria TaxID=6604 RepID=A0ABY7ENU0_MYAAR|nr:uncharacterized protein LOC128241224 [Mya arenaria]WAR10754.1 hypothetical protein MAR_035830 [Mya arenaria]